MAPSAPGTGVLFGILAALSFALWNVYLQRGLARGGTVRLALIVLALAEVGCFLPVALWLAWRGGLPATPADGLVWFLLAGVMSTTVGPFLAAQATRRIGAAQTTALRLLDPFFAYAIAAVFLGERVYGRAVGGMVLLAVALVLLQRDGADSASGLGRRDTARGLGFAVLASLIFTVGSVVRKVGLTHIPSAIVAGTSEGVAGLLGTGAILLAGSHRADLRASFQPAYRDLWWSGLAAAAGTLFLNLALQRVPVPIAVALRNTSPWFALGLVPLLIGAQHRPGRWAWISTALLTVGMLLIVLR